MNDHLCFLKYEKGQRKREERCSGDNNGWVTRIKMHVSDHTKQGGETGLWRQGLLSVPASLQSHKPPLASYLEKGWLGSPASPEAYLPQPGILCLILKSVPAAGMGMEDRLSRFSLCPCPMGFPFSLSEPSLEHVHIHPCQISQRSVSGTCPLSHSAITSSLASLPLVSLSSSSSFPHHTQP